MGAAHKELHETVLELSPVGMLALEPSGRVVLVNAELARLFGYSKDELIGTSIDQLIPERYRDLHAKHRAGYFARPESRPMGSGRILYGRRKDGTEFPVEVGLNVVDRGDESIVVASVADLSNQRAAEARFKAAFESAPNGLIMTDESGRIVLANQAAARKFGFGRNELAGMSVDDLVPKRFRDGHASSRAAFMGDASERRMGLGRDLFGLRKDGTEFPVEIGLKPLVTEDGRFVLTTIVDITGRKQLEAKIRNTQRTEALGTLANGIAHDFNNVLQNIVAVAEVVLLEEHDRETTRQLDAIVDVCSRGSDLVKRILSFSRSAEMPRGPMRPGPAVSEIADLLRASVPAAVDLEVRVDSRCPEIHSDLALLHQIVMNLVTNAIQAMPDGGALTIEADAANLSQPTSAESVVGGDLFARIAVEDTGDGIDPGVLDRVFDPFFTTKRDAGGTGLGLAVVKGIVDAHNGVIRIVPTGKGTRFEVYLPALVRGAPEGPEVDASSPTVMIVDDEPLLGDAVARILNRSGFRARHFPSGVEALSAIKDDTSWDLLLVDNFMPKMSGLEFLEQVRARGVGTPAIMLTGHLPPEPAQLASLQVVNVLAKPARRNELVQALNRALAAAHKTA